MSDNRWIELKAVRGYAMLIDSKRIFTFAQCAEPSGYKVGEMLYWGVIYAFLSDDESEACLRHHESAPLPIGYRAKIQSQLATVSRAYITTRKENFDETVPTFLGVASPFQKMKLTKIEMLNHVLTYEDWIEKCLTSA